MKAMSLDNKIYTFFTVSNQPGLQDTDKVVDKRVAICQGQEKTCLRIETERT